MAAVNYKLIKNFFNQNELKILNKYCYNKLDHNKDYVIDNQSFSPAWYNDPLMNGLLDLKLPLVEKESNLKLFPTYAYWRYYVFGGTLNKHLDRPACEISITACIKKYDNWPMIVEGTEFELEEGMQCYTLDMIKNIGVLVFIKVKEWLKYFFIMLINKVHTHTMLMIIFIKLQEKKND
jgi:hypothetical protein